MNKSILQKAKEIDARRNDETKQNEKPVKVDMEMDDLAKLMVQEKPIKPQAARPVAPA